MFVSYICVIFEKLKDNKIAPVYLILDKTVF